MARNPNDIDARADEYAAYVPSSVSGRTMARLGYIVGAEAERERCAALAREWAIRHRDEAQRAPTPERRVGHHEAAEGIAADIENGKHAMNDAVERAVAKERAACAKIARAEEEHQAAIYHKLPDTTLRRSERERAIAKAATARRIARAIERGNR